jgi:pimeloyl-ACP methyl ester carboxylesterase
VTGLHMDFSGPESGTPLVLLHGFGGDGSAWDAVKAELPDTVRVITVDLPGHGGSLNSDGRGGAGRMAKAILAGLDAAGVTSFHLAGHSMGGAVSALIAMRAPDRVKSLTLVAPGGMAKEINADLLDRYARARSADEIGACLDEMSAPGFTTPPAVVDHFVAARAKPGQTEALDETYRAMFPNGPEEGQGVLAGRCAGSAHDAGGGDLGHRRHGAAVPEAVCPAGLVCLQRAARPWPHAARGSSGCRGAGADRGGRLGSLRGRGS